MGFKPSNDDKKLSEEHKGRLHAVKTIEFQLAFTLSHKISQRFFQPRFLILFGTWIHNHLSHFL